MAEGQTSSPVNFPSGSGDVDASRFVLHQGTREELTQDNIVLNLSQKLYDLYAESSLNAVSSIQSLTEINPADATTPTDQALLVFTTMQYLQSLPSFRSGGYTAPTPPPPANNSGTTPEPEGQEPIEPTPTPNPEPEPEPNPCPLPW